MVKTSYTNCTKKRFIKLVKLKIQIKIQTFTLNGFPIRRIRIRPDLVAAFAAGHPAPVVGPSAAAGLEAVVAAAASPSELAGRAALTAG